MRMKIQKMTMKRRNGVNSLSAIFEIGASDEDETIGREFDHIVKRRRSGGNNIPLSRSSIQHHRSNESNDQSNQTLMPKPKKPIPTSMLRGHDLGEIS